MRRLALVVALAATAVLPVGAESGTTRTDAFVLMSDATPIDVTLSVPDAPAPSGGWPLLVRQHGGGSSKDNGYDTGFGLRAIPRGFALLMYSARGHGRSGGVFDWFGPRSIADFSEILDWVEANAPSVDTDTVGTWGYSQGGGMSLLPAAFDERVKAVAVGNTFEGLNRALNPMGCFKFSFATGIFLAAYKATGSRTDDATAAKWGLTFYSGTEGTSPGIVPSTEGDLNGRSPSAWMDRLVERRVPIFWAQSWEDQLFPADHVDPFWHSYAAAGVPMHRWYSSGGHAAAPDDPADVEAKEAAMLDWFDQFLRGAEHGFTTGPDMHYAQRVPGSASAWALAEATGWPAYDWKEAYVGAAGRLSSAPDPLYATTLENDFANANVASDAITNEIARNVPGLGDVVRGIPEGTERDMRTYTSAPLAGALEFTGQPFLNVTSTAASAVRSLQVSARVWDLSPDGSARLVSRGCHTSSPSFFLDYGWVPLTPNSYVFASGHRLVVQVATVDFPTWQPEREPTSVTFTGSTHLLLPVVSGSLP